MRSSEINPRWEELYEQHEKLVFLVIHREFAWTRKYPRIRHEDLEQQGRLSLIRHLQSLADGEEFHSTYAIRTIAGDIRRYLDEDKTIRVPSSTQHFWKSRGEESKAPGIRSFNDVVKSNFAVRDPDPEFVDPRFVPLPTDLLALLDELTPAQRESIERTILADETVEAVAEESGRDPRSVRQSRRSGLKKLRRIMGGG